MTHIKRITIPKNWPILKKKTTFAITPRGPYKLNQSIPLLIIIRDMLKLGNNAKEVKKIVRAGGILINNRIIKDIKFSIGLFDKISIPKIQKYFELIIKNKRFLLEEIKKEETEEKLCKIIGKKVLDKENIQINLFGGINLLLKNKNKEKIKVGDSVVLNLKELSIKRILTLDKGSNCIIIRGKNIGKIGKIIELEKGKKKSAIIENKEGKIKVFKRNIWVIE
jgi:small subunit ribosomal protein S4e